MKKVLILGALAIGSLFFSCDREDIYMSTNVMGTYTGTKECEDATPVNVTFEVLAGDSDIHIIVDGITTTIDDSDIFGSSVFQGTGREIDGDFEGRRIFFIETLKVNGQVSDRCVWKAEKH